MTKKPVPAQTNPPEQPPVPEKIQVWTEPQGEFRCRNGTIELVGAPPYKLPDPFPLDQLYVWLTKEPGEDAFIGEIMRYATTSEKKRIRRTALSGTPEIRELYRSLAVQWAPIINHDNHWHLEDFQIIHNFRIGSGWADRIVITAQDIRLVTASRGIFSFTEFEWCYGTPLIQHLAAYKEEVVGHIENVMDHIFSPLVQRKIHVLNEKGEATSIMATGLETIHPKDWKIPQGYVFTAADSET